MSDTKPKTINAKPTRDFTDATTERRFEEGKAHDFTEGEFLNFEAAGLVVATSTAADTKAKPAS